MSITTTRALCALALLAGATACDGDDDDNDVNDPEGRGHVVAVHSLGTLSVAGVKETLNHFGLDTAGVKYGVRGYQIIYQTIAPRGVPITASGYVAIPDNDDDELRLVTWMHGTLVYRREVASVNPASDDRAAAMVFASAGYAVAAPDYLGLGDGPGFHPYDNIESEAAVAIDLLRAFRKVADDEDKQLDSRVLISGVSQGGPGAMALGRALERGDEPDFQVGGLAPINGPYDHSATLHTAVTSGIMFATGYVSYLMVAWDRVHDLYASTSDAFRTPWDQEIEERLDGNHTTEDAIGTLPEKVEDLFTDEFLALMRAPTGKLAEVLKTEDAACDWKPRIPVTIYAATGDRDVPISNAGFCQDLLTGRGANAKIVDLGDLDHEDAFTASFPHVLAQFAAAR